MCGIAGIIYRDGTREVGRDMTRMLQSMKHRGPDSTGYALYRPSNGNADGAGNGRGSYAMRLKLADPNTPRDFEFADRVEDVPGAEVLSIGHSLEIVKDLGDAEQVAAEYGLDRFVGSHAIGHVRMATESDVDISGAHPYWAYPFSDVAVVHNGQLTNYFYWRRR